MSGAAIAACCVPRCRAGLDWCDCTSRLSNDQRRFLELHAAVAPPNKWRWLLGEMYLRAYAGIGKTATIARDELDQLVTVGYLRMSGIAGCVITDTGRAAL